MEAKSPLLTGFTAVIRQPRVWVVPLLWDLFKYGLALLLTTFGLGWVRWDFNLVGRHLTGQWIVPPPALPSAEQLGVHFGAEPPATVDWTWYVRSAVLVVLMTLLDPLMRAGYLNLMNAVLRGIRPSKEVFIRGMRRFGLQQILLTLGWIPVGMAQVNLAPYNPELVDVLTQIMLVLFYLAQFVIVTDDSWAIQALLGSPIVLWVSLSHTLLPLMMSLVVSGLLGFLSQPLGPLAFVLAIPAWAVLGSALAGTMVAALQHEISTRSEPGMPWACKNCKAQNSPGTRRCAVCDQPLSAAS